jgi:hypothetical protein
MFGQEMSARGGYALTGIHNANVLCGGIVGGEVGTP